MLGVASAAGAWPLGPATRVAPMHIGRAFVETIALTGVLLAFVTSHNAQTTLDVKAKNIRVSGARL